MNKSWLEKLAPLSGILAVALMIVGAIMFGVYDYLPSAERLVEILNSNPDRIFWAGYIGSISGFFLIWFVGSVFSALRMKDGGIGRLSMIAFGGGVASGVALVIGFSMILTAGARAGAEGGINAIESVTLYDIYSQILGQMFAITMAVFIGATAVVSLRVNIFPSWFGWVSTLIAVGLLTPIAYFVLAFALGWLIIASIWLYRRGL